MTHFGNSIELRDERGRSDRLNGNCTAACNLHRAALVASLASLTRY